MYTFFIKKKAVHTYERTTALRLLTTRGALSVAHRCHLPRKARVAARHTRELNSRCGGRARAPGRPGRSGSAMRVPGSRRTRHQSAKGPCQAAPGCVRVRKPSNQPPTQTEGEIWDERRRRKPGKMRFYFSYAKTHSRSRACQARGRHSTAASEDRAQPEGSRKGPGALGNAVFRLFSPNRPPASPGTAAKHTHAPTHGYVRAHTHTRPHVQTPEADVARVAVAALGPGAWPSTASPRPPMPPRPPGRAVSHAHGLISAPPRAPPRAPARAPPSRLGDPLTPCPTSAFAQVLRAGPSGRSSTARIGPATTRPRAIPAGYGIT